MNAPDEQGEPATHEELTRHQQWQLVRRLAGASGLAQVVETDISWILLVDDVAYKLKKVLSRDVLDYSSLKARYFACEEELRLNRRLAPALYLGLTIITGTLDQPTLDGEGDVLDVAVRMRRFPQSAIWQARLDAGCLGNDEARCLAVALATLHANAMRAERQRAWGNGRQIRGRTREDLAGVAALLDHRRQHVLLAEIAAWMGVQEQRLARIFARRKEEGWVRECHGDLHCGNILTLDGQVSMFDGIEFNPALRWIDVAQDLAFIWMDLECQGQAELAARLLNDYLEHSGDYGALAVLPYYRVQRALVRCKVALQRALPDAPGRIAARAQAGRYLAFAHGCAGPGAPAVLITHGLSGSGKSWLSDALVEPLAAVRLRSDVERKRLRPKDVPIAGMALPEQGVYDRPGIAATYRQLARFTRIGLVAGFPMLVDATFLERARRLVFRRLAQRCHTPFVLLLVHAPAPLLAVRLMARARSGADPSDADLAVLASQLALSHRQAVAPDEAELAIDVCNDEAFGSKALSELVSQLRKALHRPGQVTAG